MVTETTVVAIDDAHSAVSWKAILAGTVASAALTLVLVAFGVGVGFSVISPWGGSGVSATTFTIGAGIYLIVIAMLSSTVGGYLAGRLRSRWSSVHEHERYFRDSAHGVLVWALTTVVTATFLGGAVTGIIGATGSGIATVARSGATDIYVDQMLRTAPARAAAASTPAAPAAQSPAQAVQQTTEQATSPSTTAQTAPQLQGGGITPPATPRILPGNRDEISRIVVPALAKGGAIADIDRTYLASIVAERTGLSQAEAEQRVNQVITQAQQAADNARKSARNFAFWLTFAMLAGALSAALAAIEGGNLRNREWYLTGADRARVMPAE